MNSWLQELMRMFPSRLFLCCLLGSVSLVCGQTLCELICSATIAFTILDLLLLNLALDLLVLSKFTSTASIIVY